MAIFAKTIDHGSFRGAAKELSLSPSVVSHHISQLEENLGVALLYRSTRKLTLTREGERLLSATRDMLAAVESEIADLSASASTPSGELRVTVPSVLSQSKFADRIAAFKHAYPRIQLLLDFSDTRHGLIESGFDFAIRMGRGAKTSATSRKLFAVKRRIIASKEYFDKHGTPENPEELLDHDWLALMPAQHTNFSLRHSSGEVASIKPVPGLLTNDAQALFSLARAGAGLAIVPDFLAEGHVSSGTMAYVLSEWELPSIDVFAEWPANAPKHGLIHLALKELGTADDPDG